MKIFFYAVAVSLIYRATNRRESLTPELKNKIDDGKACNKVGTKGGPTHVVNSITRGFRAILNFKRSLRNFEKKSELLC